MEITFHECETLLFPLSNIIPEYVKEGGERDRLEIHRLRNSLNQTPQMNICQFKLNGHAHLDESADSSKNACLSFEAVVGGSACSIPFQGTWLMFIYNW